jgi:hypothetical protein
MSTVLQTKLLRHEMSPPKGNWEAIAARLDTEFNSQDIIVSQKIDTIEAAPPSDAWKNILLSLEENNTPGSCESYYHQLETMGCSCIGNWYCAHWFYCIILQNLLLKQLLQTRNHCTEKKNGIATHYTFKVPVIPTVTNKNNNKTLTASLAESFKRKPHPIHSSSSVEENIITPVDITETAAVTAPLLRDSKGNVIMDMNLLTTGSSNYISVTGPNGEQTRISTKFANYLMYLNKDGGDNEEYIDYLIRNSNFWKTRFEQWSSSVFYFLTFSKTQGTLASVISFICLWPE